MLAEADVNCNPKHWWGRLQFEQVQIWKSCPLYICTFINGQCLALFWNLGTDLLVSLNMCILLFAIYSYTFNNGTTELLSQMMWLSSWLGARICSLWKLRAGRLFMEMNIKEEEEKSYDVAFQVRNEFLLGDVLFQVLSLLPDPLLDFGEIIKLSSRKYQQPLMHFILHLKKSNIFWEKEVIKNRRKPDVCLSFIYFWLKLHFLSPQFVICVPKGLLVIFWCSLFSSFFLVIQMVFCLYFDKTMHAIYADHIDSNSNLTIWVLNASVFLSCL